MKAVHAIGATMLALAVGVVQAQSGAVGATSSEPGRVAATEVVRVEAKVEAINRTTREVTLKRPNGESAKIVAGPEVRNLDKVNVGDIVAVEYLQSLVLELKKGGGAARTRVDSSTAVRAEPGQQPAGAAAQQIRVVADVIAVDAKNQSIRLRGPKQTGDVKVRDPEQFKLIKVGDQIEATYTEAVGIAVEPKPAAAKK